MLAKGVFLTMPNYPHPIEEILDTVIATLIDHRSQVVQICNVTEVDMTAVHRLEVLLGDVRNTLERDYKITRVE
jgi:hypothetical protein